jgi:hypothetical protein
MPQIEIRPVLSGIDMFSTGKGFDNGAGIVEE